MPPATARTRTAPIHPRRISGPTRRPVPVGAPVRGRTGAFERLSRLPDHRVVDRVLRSRGIIWIIGILLGGIVAMQVSLLQLNTGISRAVQAQDTLVRQNSTLQTQIAGYSSGDRVRNAALDDNMVDPPAGDTRYVTVHAGDASRAAHRMRPPSELAQAIMENGGITPGSLAAPGTTGAAVAGTGPTPATTVAAGTTGAAIATGTTPTTGATGTSDPASITGNTDGSSASSGTAPTGGPIRVTPTATAAPTVTPAPTVAPAPDTGAAAAPQG